MEIPAHWTGRALFRSPETAVLHCDASQRAWGGVLNQQTPARGRPHQQGEHITAKELRAVLYTVETFLGNLRGRHVRLWEEKPGCRGCSPPEQGGAAQAPEDN